MPVQPIPFQGSNPLRTIALAENIGNQRRAADQRDRSLNLRETALGQQQQRFDAQQKRLSEQDTIAARQAVGSLVHNALQAAVQHPEEEREAVYQRELAPYLPAIERVVQSGALSAEDAQTFLQPAPGSFAGNPMERFSNPQEFLDDDGNPVVAQVGQRSGTVRQLEGLNPRPRSGESISVGPDGGVTITRGPGAGLSNSTTTQVQKDKIEQTELLALTRKVMADFKPEFQTVSRRFHEAATSLKAKFSPESISPDERRSAEEFADYKANASNLQSQGINKLAGAAVSKGEEERLKGFLIDPGTGLFDGDDFITAERKLRNYEDLVEGAIARLSWFEANGTAATEENFNKFPVEDMEGVMKRRHGEIMNSLSAANPDMPAQELRMKARETLGREFGLL